MKLLRYGPPGQEEPGVLDNHGNIHSLTGIVDDIDGQALASGSLNGIDIDRLPTVDQPVRLGPCIGKVGKFLCIGLNYADHAAESGAEVPLEPEVFMKATSAISGPNDNIIQPKGSSKLDWEVELALVIGKPAAYVSEDEAIDIIAGYCICNDISERHFQLERGSQWDKGKGCDTFGPLGPWLVTKDEIKDPSNLNMWLEVNGRRFQDGNTKTMLFGPARIVSYLSHFMSLQPGDVVSTGTPAGVGMGQTPPIYLQRGDEVELGIDSLGIQRQVVTHV